MVRAIEDKGLIRSRDADVNGRIKKSQRACLLWEHTRSALEIWGVVDFTMKNRKGMKEMAPKGLKRFIHACTRSVTEIKPVKTCYSSIFMLFMLFMLFMVF